MPLEGFEIEGEISATYRDARLDPANAPGVIQLARRVPGIVGVEFVSVLGAWSSELVENDDGTATIRVRDGLTLQAMLWNVGHELGEFRLRRRQPFAYVEPDRERVCNNLAAGYLMPRPALRNRFLTFGVEQLPRIASSFGVTQVMLALRVGEALDIPVAVVGVGLVRRRGPVDHLPADHDLAKIVRRKRPPRGWQLAQLSDTTWCWALFGPY